MKISQIRHFQAVCQYQNVTRAAESLHITQPSVSSSIKELEEEFGVNLFHRINKRLVLTREGEFFLERTNLLLEQVDTLEAQMKDLGSGKNLIRIGVPPMIGTFLFPAMFDAFHEKYPEIKLEMVEQGSRMTNKLVKSEELDLAIAIVDEAVDHELHKLDIFSTRLVFCVRAGHPLACRASVGLQDLRQEPIILFKSDSSQNAILLSRFKSLDIEPNVLLSSSQLYTIKHFVAAGRAGAFLFQEIADMEPDIAGVPLEEPIPMDICLIWKKNRHIYSDAAKFIEFTKMYNGGAK